MSFVILGHQDTRHSSEKQRIISSSLLCRVVKSFNWLTVAKEMLAQGN